MVKKIVAPFLAPVPLGLVVSLFGLFFLWFTKKQRTGKVFVSIGFFMILLFGYGSVPDHLLGSLEDQYNRYNMELSNELLKSQNKFPLKFVVVLGGGHVSDSRLPTSSQLGESSLVRLVEGITIYRKHPGSKLVLSGGVVFDPIPEAMMMARVAGELGVDRNDIILENQSRDTKDEVIFIQPIVKDNPFVLVTSAAHMPRTMALFQKQNLDPIPAPTQHYVKQKKKSEPASYLPSAENLHKAKVAFYEYLGMFWAKLRGQI